MVDTDLQGKQVQQWQFAQMRLTSPRMYVETNMALALSSVSTMHQTWPMDVPPPLTAASLWAEVE